MKEIEIKRERGEEDKEQEEEREGSFPRPGAGRAGGHDATLQMVLVLMLPPQAGRLITSTQSHANRRQAGRSCIASRARPGRFTGASVMQ